MLKKTFTFIITLGILSTFCNFNCFAEFYNLSNYLSSITEFETDRLVLTPTVEDDLDILSEYLLDKDVSRYLDPSIENGFNTKEEALLFLKGEHEATEYFEFTIKLKGSKNPIGTISIQRFDNQLISPGYWLGKDFHGKGYASEACCKLLSNVFKAIDVKTIYIACDYENYSSIKLTNKILDYIEQNNKDIELIRTQKEDFVVGEINEKTISFHYFKFVISKEIIENDISTNV